MVRARVVFNLVLDELEARQSDCVERKVISATGVGKSQRLGPQIAKRCQPLTEQAGNLIVALQVHAADLARAVVEIEIAGELVVFGSLYQDRSRRRGSRTIAVAG